MKLLFPTILSLFLDFVFQIFIFLLGNCAFCPFFPFLKKFFCVLHFYFPSQKYYFLYKVHCKTYITMKLPVSWSGQVIEGESFPRNEGSNNSNIFIKNPKRALPSWFNMCMYSKIQSVPKSWIHLTITETQTYHLFELLTCTMGSMG